MLSRRTRTLLKWTGAAIGGLGLLLTIAWFDWDARASRRMEAKLAEVRAAGYELDYWNLDGENSTEDLDEEENGAQAYLEAFALLDAIPYAEEERCYYYLDRRVEWLRTDVEEGTRTFLIEFFESHREVFEAFEAGAKFIYCRFNSPEDPITRVAGSIKAAKVLCLRARIQALEGQPEESFRTLLASMALADPKKNEDVLIRMVLTSFNLRLLEDLMLAGWIPDEELHSLHDSIDPKEFWKIMEEHTRYELAFDATVFMRVIEDKDLDDLLVNPEAINRIARSSFTRPLIKNDFVTYLERVVPLIEACRKPYHVSRSMIEAFERQESDQLSWANPVSTFLLENMMYFGQSAADSEVLQLLARTAIELELKRRETGSLPETMENLPIDPFSGKPIGYDLENGMLRSAGGSNGPVTWQLKRK